jgi:uncharacterized protein YkwD
MKVNLIRSIIVFAATLLPLAVQAAQDGKFLELINAYRANPPPCEGRAKEPVQPLEPSSILAGLEVGAARQLKEAMRAAGFLAARAEALTLAGASNTHAAMRFAMQLNFSLLLSQRYSVAGVARQGRDWQIVLAQPLLPPDLGDWQNAGRQVLQLVNTACAIGRGCGNKYHEAAPPLHWSAKLGAVSLAHSQNMAEHNYFGHESSNGNTVGVRARDEGYTWRSIGENVATGRARPEQVVEGWLSSPGHCASIMNGTFTEMGAAYAVIPKSNTIIYWTQVFGRPR